MCLAAINPAQAARIALPFLLVNAATLASDCDCFSALVLGWRHEPDAALAVMIALQLRELHYSPGRRPALVSLRWVILACTSLRLRVRGAIVAPRYVEESEHYQLLQLVLSITACVVLPLSACSISCSGRPLLIRSRRQARPTSLAAICASFRSATLHSTTLRLQTSITR